MTVLQQIWLYEIIGGMLPMCQNTTMKIDGVLWSETYNSTLHSCHNFPAGSRQAARGARICEKSLLCKSHNFTLIYHQTSNISRTKLDHSDVVGASPVGAAPTTSPFPS